MSRPLRNVFTHALALGAGWAIYHAGVPGKDSSGSGSQSLAAGASHKTELSLGAARILAAAKAAAEEPFAPGLNTKTREEALKRIESMMPPADIAAALDTLALSYVVEPGGDAPDSPEAIALIYHWLGKDPEEFFQWAKSQGDPTGKMVRQQLWETVQLQFETKGAAALLPMLASAEKTGFGRGVANSLAHAMAREPDMDLIAKVKASASKESWNEFIGSLYQAWPADRSADFAKLAASENKPGLLTYFNPGKPRAEWLRDLLVDESLPAEFREAVRTNPKLKETLANDTSLSLEERLAYAGKQDDARSRAGICRNDVDQVLGNDRDWPRAFRRGEATAQEVLDAVRAATPELATASPEALRDRVFERLVGEDPAGAMLLLADLPAEERNARVLHTALREFDQVEPDRFLELLQQVPEGIAADREARLDAWNRRCARDDEEERENYTAWVQALPPGIDREMALFSLARVVAGKDPSLAESLRGQITDKDLKQRILSR